MRIIYKYAFTNNVYTFIYCVFFLLSIQSCGSSGVDSSSIHIDDENKLPEELQVLNLAIQKNPSNHILYLERGTWLHNHQRYAAALSDVEKAMEIDGNSKEVFKLKSKIELDYFQSMASIETLREAIKIWPADPEFKSELAQVYIVVEQYSKAETEAQNILQNNPLSAEGYFLMGWISRLKKDTVKAIQYLQKTTQMDADRLNAWVDLAQLTAPKQPALAKSYFENALIIAPQDTTLLHSYALYWQNLNELNAAKNQYQEILLHYPVYQPALYNYALLLMDQDSFGLALESWDRLMTTTDTTAKYFYYRGICYELTDNLERAEMDYQRAYQLNPNLPNIQKALASIQEKLIAG